MKIIEELEQEVLRLCALVQQGDLSALWSLEEFAQSLSHLTQNSAALFLAQEILSIYSSQMHK